MGNYIVTTTIHEPTEALVKFSRMEDWKLIVVGDQNTPHEAYKDFPCIYLSPEYQQENYPELSEAIGWNCIMRRNLGFLEAYKLGATVVATVDDDNIPYEEWGTYVNVGYTIPVDVYGSLNKFVLDPMKLTNHPELWHRGYPIEYCRHDTVFYRGRMNRKILIQADLWDGDPDVDAICRKMYYPTGIKLEIDGPFSADCLSPFNSQNTFLAREILPYYMCLPHVGRMDDIWGGYLAQWYCQTYPLYMPATVYQNRNEQNINKNLYDETIGYMYSGNFAWDIENWRTYVPEETAKAYDLYRKAYELLGV